MTRHKELRYLSGDAAYFAVPHVGPAGDAAVGERTCFELIKHSCCLVLRVRGGRVGENGDRKFKG